MTGPRVVVARAVPDAALELLAGVGSVWTSAEDRPLTTDELRAAVVGADALVSLLHDRVDAELLDAAGPQLRVVANVAVGYDNVDVAACRDRGVVVTNTPGVLTEATADLTMALLLGITRRVGEGDRLLRERTPWSWAPAFMLGTGLRGLRLGLVGFGEIARAVAVRAAAFGMEIAYTSRRPAPAEVEQRYGAVRLDLDELLRTSDVVSLHCPLTPETHHLVDRSTLASMKRGAYLVNTARGPVVDEAALAEALAAGQVRGAALDVFEREPQVHEALLSSDAVLLTPHLGSATEQTREAMALLAARNVAEVLAGRPALTPV